MLDVERRGDVGHMESNASTNTNGMGCELAEFFFIGDALMFDWQMHFVSPEVVPSDK
jgi:hypothetical protein